MPSRRPSVSSQQALELKEKRRQQLATVSDLVGPIRAQLDLEARQHKTLTLLESVAEGLYEEIDKLTKKYSDDPVTDLVLEHVNDVIKEANELIPNDPYVQRIKQFVPAGQKPEHRDVLIIVRQLRQGLSRFKETLAKQTTHHHQLLGNAMGFRVALQLFMDGDEHVDKDELKAHDVSVSSEWLDGSLRSFRFNRLDRVNLTEYFTSEP